MTDTTPMPATVTMSAAQTQASHENLAAMIVAGISVQNARTVIADWAAEQAEAINAAGFSRAACTTCLVDYKIAEYSELSEELQMDAKELGYYVTSESGDIKLGREIRSCITAGVKRVYGEVSQRKRWSTELEVAGMLAYFVERGMTPDAAAQAAGAIAGDKDARLQVRKVAA